MGSRGSWLRAGRLLFRAISQEECGVMAEAEFWSRAQMLEPGATIPPGHPDYTALLLSSSLTTLLNVSSSSSASRETYSRKASLIIVW